MLFHKRAPLSLLLLAVVTTPCVAQLTVTCFNGGPSGDCVQFAATFCSSLAGLTIFPGDTVSHCFNGPTDGSSCARRSPPRVPGLVLTARLSFFDPGAFTAVNTLTNSAVPKTVNCESALFAVADECIPGGGAQSAGSNFRFWMDPNAIACGSPNGI
ncbi:hypothetical protein C8J57DRAFT_342827 [Mycena rebaudengoi]|nr:hypothetical protein C8J57DRAFT_342827 [Mycena rebaudengoi]